MMNHDKNGAGLAHKPPARPPAPDQPATPLAQKQSILMAVAAVVLFALTAVQIVWVIPSQASALQEIRNERRAVSRDRDAEVGRQKLMEAGHQRAVINQATLLVQQERALKRLRQLNGEE